MKSLPVSSSRTSHAPVSLILSLRQSPCSALIPNRTGLFSQHAHFLHQSPVNLLLLISSKLWKTIIGGFAGCSCSNHHLICQRYHPIVRKNLWHHLISTVVFTMCGQALPNPFCLSWLAGILLLPSQFLCGISSIPLVYLYHGEALPFYCKPTTSRVLQFPALNQTDNEPLFIL